MNTKNIFTVALLLGALSLSLISCSGNGGNTSGVATLEWWQFWTDPAIKPTIEQMVAEFESANPNIKINLTDLTWANGHEKIVVAFSSGTAPDIVELGSDWVPEFSSVDQLASITSDVTVDSSQFFGWAPGIYENEIYAHPWILGTRVLYINKELMTRAGFSDDFAPYNWPQFKELCYKIDSLGNDIYGFGSNAAEKHRLYKKYLPFFWSHDGRIMSLDGKYCVFSSDKAYKSLKFYKELSDSCSMIDTQRRLEDAFLAGKIGVIMSGDWLLKRINNEGHEIEFTTSIMPGPDYPGKSFSGGEYLAVSAVSKHKTEATKFIKFITNQENQLRFCKANFSANPSNKAASNDPFFTEDIHLQTFVRQINMSRMSPAMPEWVYVEGIIEEALEDVLFNDAPMAETLYETKRKIEDLLIKK